MLCTARSSSQTRPEGTSLVEHGRHTASLPGLLAPNGIRQLPAWEVRRLAVAVARSLFRDCREPDRRRGFVSAKRLVEPLPTPGDAPRNAVSTTESVPSLQPAQLTTWGVRLASAIGVAFFLAMVAERLIWTIAYPLGLIFGAVVVAQGVVPAVNWLSRWLPRPLAAVLVYLILLAGAAAAGWFVTPVLVAQANLFLAEVPALETWLRATAAEQTMVDLDSLLDATQSQILRLSGQVVQLPVALVSAGTSAVLVLFLSLYWTIAQPQMRGWVLSLVPEAHRDRTRDLLGEVGSTIGGYVRGVVISALVIGITTYVGLLVIGLPNPLALAALAGFGALIPVLGPFLSAIPALAVALLTGEREAVLVLIFYIGVQQVESNLLLPLIMREQARIPPLLSLVAFVVGAAVGGIVGALIAIPLFGALRVVVVRVLVPAERDLIGVDSAEAAAVRREEMERDADEEDEST